MFAILWFCLLVVQVRSGGDNDQDSKPYMVYPLPLEMPNRNDRADQCWVRVEDIELTQMITVYCYIAHAFLRDYIYEYNLSKMAEDKVVIRPWRAEIRDPKNLLPPPGNSTAIDWRMATIMDTITHMRIYVTVHADCRLIMYSREGTSNYKVNCGKLLYYVNSRTSNDASALCCKLSWFLIAFVSIWCV